MEQLKRNIDERKSAYLEARTIEEQALALLDKLNGKVSSLSEELCNIESELDSKKSLSNIALVRYAADEISDQELAKLRRKCSDLEQRKKDLESIIAALIEETKKSATSLQEARNNTDAASKIFWLAVGDLESTNFLINTTPTIKRTYLVRRRAFAINGAYSLGGYLKDLLENKSIDDSEEASIWKELEKEYGVPRY